MPDKIQKLTNHLYLRYVWGEDLEEAYLCVDDGEPDMNDLASMSFANAKNLEKILLYDQYDSVKQILEKTMEAVLTAESDN